MHDLHECAHIPPITLGLQHNNTHYVQLGAQYRDEEFALAVHFNTLKSNKINYKVS